MPPRINEFKFTGKSDKLSKKRREFAVSLRKDKRREKFAHKRDITPAQVATFVETTKVGKTIVELVPFILDDSDPAEQHSAVVELRRLLATSRTLPIQATIDSGVLPKLVTMLSWEAAPETQYEAAWVLTNVSSGTADQTMAVVEVEACLPLCNLLLSDVEKVRDQACWCLGNIAGDGSMLRDMLIEMGALDHFLTMLLNEETVGLLRNVSWAISNFFRWKSPPAPEEKMGLALSALSDALTKHEDQEVVSNVCWSICYITEAAESFLDLILEHFGQVFMGFLRLPTHDAQLPCLRALGSITAGSDEQTDSVLALGLLDVMVPLMSSPKSNIRKDACWTLSNICAGTTPQIDAVISKNLVQGLIILATRDAAYKVASDAAWSLCNIASQGEDKHRYYLLQVHSVESITFVLSDQLDVSGITVFMDALDNLFEFAGRIGDDTPILRFQESGGLAKLHELSNHPSEEVSTRSFELLDTYFSDEAAELAELQPEVHDDAFAFGTASQDKNNGEDAGGQFDF
eukprot:m.354218 g.354218  ORF g.354218 m.354218 type:complete len:518 (+) comp16958_c0_seq1:406-1959(+)